MIYILARNDNALNTTVVHSDIKAERKANGELKTE